MGTSNAEKSWFQRYHKEPSDENKQQTVCENTTVHEPSNPTRKGNGFADIAGMETLKSHFHDSFINVLNHKEYALQYGIKPPSILLYGPSGCGKTFFAEKLAEEVHINYKKIIPDDLACTWIHGTQQRIGEVFKEAEKHAPTLLFFDEFETMVPRRSNSEGNEHINGEVNEFLCRLNNATERNVYIIAATNHPELMDKAILRPGRIDEIIYVGLPDLEARKSLFDLSLSKLPSSNLINYLHLANLTDGYSCSDISYVVKAAARKMFNLTTSSGKKELQPITQDVIEEIISIRHASVSRKDLREYERMRIEFSSNERDLHPVSIGYR